MLVALRSWHRANQIRFGSLHPTGCAHATTTSLCYNKRSLLTLAIETSCDDTSVAILEMHDEGFGGEHQRTSPATKATLYFHEKVTAVNTKFRGIHPAFAVESHQEHLGHIVSKSLNSLPLATSSKSNDHITTIMVHSGEQFVVKRKPDFISVTRGPGMRACLATGLEIAKGLAVAWQTPLVAVNHMQAHALTPRLVSAVVGSSRSLLSSGLDTRRPLEPAFPFLTLLVSGGHTLLLLSRGLTDHTTLGSTVDIAIGDFIDKAARSILPESVINPSDNVMYGRLLENFAFPNDRTTQECGHNYIPPSTSREERFKEKTRWGWSLPVPFFDEAGSSSESGNLRFSFSGLGSAVERICEQRKTLHSDEMSHEERVDLAKETMKIAFEHLAKRAVLALTKFKSAAEIKQTGKREIDTVVVSGGVASNKYLQTILRSYLDIKGFAHIQLSIPPARFCTDNAAMIGWAGIEMWQQGWQSELNVRPLRKWSLDTTAEDGGILGVGGWMKHGKRFEVQKT